MDRQANATLNDLELMLLDQTIEPKALPLSLLEEATSGFSADHEIGRGGFAVVYKGLSHSGMVAVKRLFNAYMKEKEFHREVQCLMKVKHKNIVRFLGYCADTQGNMKKYDGKLIMADVQQKLLCFEYLPNGNLHNYVTDAPCRLEWRTCYKIIKGICNGLHYLHENRIVHLDLKPGNVLLDDTMEPKIADFGLSRCFEEKQTSQIASKLVGSVGYFAPEFHSGKITFMSDIYSLGVIIIEMLTGKKGFPDVEHVLQIWRNRLEKSLEDTQIEQVRLCTNIGIQCTESNPAKRPVSAQHIIERLEEVASTDEVKPGSSKLLDVHPLVHYFPCAPNGPGISSLYLTNDTDEHVAFSLVEKLKTGLKFFETKTMPRYGVVPPRSTYTLILEMDHESMYRLIVEEKYINMILEGRTLGDTDTIESETESIDELVEEPKDKGKTVQEVTLKAVAVARPDVIPELIPTKMKILPVKERHRQVGCFDVNPTKEWVMTGHENGYARIWNSETQRKVHSLIVSRDAVTSVKFIERKKWFVVASDDDWIHVYNYETKIHKITSFRAGSKVAVHPNRPYLLSTSKRHMELRDWDNDWELTHISVIDHLPCQFAFNPKDKHTFAIAFENNTVEVWTIDPPICKYTLCGHTDKVKCLDFFTYDDQPYLITGSTDCTAKIWDMHKYTCICTIRASTSPIMSVLFHPNLLVLIIGSADGTVHFLSWTNFRKSSAKLERIIDTEGTAVWGLACFLRSKGVLIGQKGTIAIMDIDNLNYQEESRHSSEPQLIDDTGPADTVTQCPTRPAQEKLVVIGSSAEKMPGPSKLLEVHPLELRFPFQPNKSTQCSLDLINNTDERVAFRLVAKTEHTKYFANLPMYGIIPSRSTYTLVVTAEKQKKLEKKFDLILQSTISGDMYIVQFEYESECDELFEEFNETGNAVHEVAMKAVFYPEGEKPELSRAFVSMVVSHGDGMLDRIVRHMKRYGKTVLCLQAHPTEKWILTGDRKGNVHMWDLVTQKRKDSFRVSHREVHDVKFIGRKPWFLVGTSAGLIHVCTYGTKIQEIRSFRAGIGPVTSMAIHPTQPYVLSAANRSQIKIWDWDKGWECTHTYENEHSSTINQLIFNPKDTNIFASASRDHTVKVWSVDSPKSSYTLFGHLDEVNCLDFFSRGGEQYLISGSDDFFLRIWDLQKRACIHTTEALMSPVLSVASIPDRPYLIIGLEDGTVHLRSSTHFRFRRIFNFGLHGKVHCVHLLGPGRVVIGQESTMSIMDMDNVKPADNMGDDEPEEDMDNFCKATHNA